MKVPRWSHVVTKGLSALHKSLSLITKGIQDQKVGGKPIPKINEVNFYFGIVGRKSFSEMLCFNIKGCISKVKAVTLAIFAKKQVLEKSYYSIKAKIAKTIQYQYEIQGRKILDFIHNILLGGKKDFFIADCLVQTQGRKLKKLNVQTPVLAKKSFISNSFSPIKGAKKINSQEKILVKGKKDIYDILLALNMVRKI